MKRKRGGISTVLFILLVLVAFVGILWLNSAPVEPPAPVAVGQLNPTEDPNVIAQILSRNFGSEGTAVPTVALPTLQPTQPIVLQPAGPSATPISAAEVVDGTSVALVNQATPTLPPPTSELPAQSQSLPGNPDEWNPPPLIPPLSLDPEGKDHFWFHRPVKSNANNTVLAFYTYGSDGSDEFNPLRVHHGIDMPNPIGEEVLAASDGVVVFAADGRLDETSIFQNSGSYGNVIQIQHDFGYNGQPIFTLYAHLQAALVQEGQRVEAGQVIGLIGNSGRVSGPHVHFEVRVGENRYGATYNPILWMVPFDGHGVVAGRVLDENGEFLNDWTVTLRNRSTGLPQATTTTYVFNGTVDDVNPDPVRQENFAIPDVPNGRYDVIVTIDGQRVVRQVDVVTGTTSFVELRPPQPEAPATGVGENSDG